jgi:ATP-dependent Clp protease ATP-binding subunit ClpA
MPSDFVFPIGLLHRKVAPAAILTEPLFVPELARLAATRETAVAATTKAIQKFLADRPTDELIRRRRATTAREHAFTLTLDPPRQNESWREPVELTFHAAVWEHEGYALARVPAVGIEVIATLKDDLDAVLRRETLSALRRLNASANLKNLSALQTTTAFRVEWIDVPVKLRSLKERAVRAEDDDEEEKKTALQQVGTLLVPEQLAAAYEVDDAVKQVADALTAKPPQSVLLVGPSGVGKTAVLRELVRRKATLNLAAAPFFQTSGSRIVAGQCGFGMWEKRCQDLVKDAVKRRAVVHVGSLAELMDVGKSEFNPTGIATFLRPAIARGELLCVAECTSEQLPLIEKENPQLPDAFRHVTVEEPDAEKGKRILAAFAADHRRREPTSPALAAIDRLHRRYATYSAYPGRPLRFLHNLVRDGERGTPVSELDVYAGFTRETGLPREIIDPDEALDLTATHDWFSSRVVGQPEAVGIVVDLLATIKAGLTRANRPIASLLFIGPTGVGKTELAKAVAEYLFGSRDRLTRFDMSEYADPISVRRLVGTGFGTEGLLTAKVREQPFCVLLLDEVEKAHASAFDLLLQALGEARLTDAGGRLADFRNTVVILTSNLGAESFRSGTPGFASGTPTVADAKAHFTKAVEKFLRPEMFNRLDRVVPFGSLPADVIRAIADREWQKVLRRDGVRFRDAAVTTGDGLLDHLAAVGFDPRYGARPLKRAMERELLAPLAKQMNRHAGDTALTVDVGVAGGDRLSPSPLGGEGRGGGSAGATTGGSPQLPAPLTPLPNPPPQGGREQSQDLRTHGPSAVVVKVRPVQGAKPASAADLGPHATAAQNQRRWHQLLQQSTVVRELENDVTQLLHREARILAKQKRGRNLGKELQAVLADLGRLREVHAEIVRQREQVVALEDAALVAFHTDAPPGDLPDCLRAAEAEWDKLLLRLYALNEPKGQQVCLHLFAESRTTLADLVTGYREIARTHQFVMTCVRYRLPGQHPLVKHPDKLPPQAHKGHKAESYWHEDKLFHKRDWPHKLILWREPVPVGFDPSEKDDVIGFALQFTGPGSHLRFSAEGGWHQFDKPDRSDADTPHALAFATSDKLEAFVPDERLTRKGAIEGDVARRIFNRKTGTALDADWKKVRPTPALMMPGAAFPAVLAAAVDLTVRVRLTQMILE